MPVVPEPPTIDDGTLTSSELNQFRDAIAFLQRPPIAVLRQTASQTITTGTWTSLTFGAEDVDTDVNGVGGHSTASDTSRYTARYPGWYLCAGSYSAAASATGRRQTRWAVNGSFVNASQYANDASAAFETSSPAIGKLVYLAAGDYVELQAFQSSGGNLGTQPNDEQQSGMSIAWKSL